MADKLKIITVKAAKEDGRVALFEAHPDNVTDDNKDGEVFVVGDGKEWKVARTPTVEQKLRDGILVEVGVAPVAWLTSFGGEQSPDDAAKAAAAKKGKGAG
jgi:hypothetical protein